MAERAEEYLKNAKWVKRIGEMYEQLDKAHDGYVSREDMLVKVDKIAKDKPDRPNEIAKLREVTLMLANALGLTEGAKVDKQKYIELNAKMAASEYAKLQSGDETWMGKLDNAWFDVVDTNHDGKVTWDEYRLIMTTNDFSEEAAKAAFDMLDKDKSGKLDRKELSAAYMKFWLNMDDQDTQGMHGDKFE